MSTRSESHEIDEQAIIERVRKGDARAYELLVKRYETPVYNLMLRMTRNSETALDLAQDTFVKAYEKMESFDKKRNFFPWLYTLGMNIARDHLRRQGKQAGMTQSLDDMPADAAPFRSSEDPFARACDRDSVNHALAQLPADMREALVMRFREEFSYKEIAEALNIGASNAKMKIHRALKLLRHMLGREEAT